jgi:hypothetical protein
MIGPERAHSVAIIVFRRGSTDAGVRPHGQTSESGTGSIAPPKGKEHAHDCSGFDQGFGGIGAVRRGG